MPLTVKQCQNAKSGRHSDGRGLYLLVKPKGARSWVLRVQSRLLDDGERKDFGIGSYLDSRSGPPPVELSRLKSLTLAEAREKAKLGRDLAKAGINPSELWNKPEAAPAPTFEQAAREFHAEIEKGWRNGKHGAQWLSTLENYAFPLIGNMTVDAVEASDVQSVLLPIWLTKGETARRVRQRVLATLDYAHAKKWRDKEAPARAVGQLMKAIKQPRGGNFAAAPWAEVPGLMAKLRADTQTMGRLALQFCVLTAARSGEVRKARWSEMDLGAKEWRLPAEHTKTRRPHIIPLTPAAIAVLNEAKGLFDGDPNALVFVGNKGRALSDATMAKALSVAGGGNATVHGMRSAFRDWAADTGQPDAWAEAALAHGIPDKVEAAYRRTVFFPQRRDTLMPAWDSFLSEPSNIVSLADRRA